MEGICSYYVVVKLRSWGVAGKGGKRKGVIGNFCLSCISRERCARFFLIFLSITRLHKGVKIQGSKL